MVEQALAHPGGDPVAGAAAPEVIARWTEVLSGALAPDRGPGEGLDLAVLDDAGRVETIRALEELGCVLTAAQARLSADLDASIRAHRAAAGVPRARQGAGVAAQVALARRTSPRRGQQHLGLAGIVGRELPCTWTAWRTGQIDEWKATVVARETGCLEVGDRLAVDAVLGADLERLATCGVRELAGWVAGEAARLDPAGVTARRRRAEADRHVGLRPAPDTMTWLTALLPVADGVAVHAALTRAADTARAAGDPRRRGQVMADTLTQSVRDRALPVPDPERASRAPVEISLVMSDQALLAGADDVAHLGGYGPVPAELAREMVLGTLDARAQVWVRRVFADRAGHLVGMESRRRLFPSALARFVRLRDQICRTPWCDAPIRHIDHVRGHAREGPTSADNAQGLCEACDYAKQARGWSARAEPDVEGHQVHTTTPSGHRYRSRAPTLATIGTTRVRVDWVIAV